MARRAGKKPLIMLDDPGGWPKLQASLDQLIEICENDYPPNQDMRTSMTNYSIVYDLSVQRPPNNYCDELYRCAFIDRCCAILHCLPNAFVFCLYIQCAGNLLFLQDTCT